MKIRKGTEGSRSARRVAERAGKTGKKAKRKSQGAGIAGWSALKGTDWQNKTIADFYRPLKKPITVRIDADVLAWFKKDGRRYQTRINEALRKVMEQELKAAK